MKTAVLQSFRTHDVPTWIARCMDSVERWTRERGWDYRFLDDRFFDYAPDWVRERCMHNVYATTDVCRLRWMVEELRGGYERVIWMDADVVVFDGPGFRIHAPQGHAFAHELFFLFRQDGSYDVHGGINNAVMVFDRDQPVLEFYLYACLARLRNAAPGPIERTLLGPALLRDLTRAVPLEVLTDVALFSPPFMREIVAGGGPLLGAYVGYALAQPAAANLCHFMRNLQPAQDRPLFDEIYANAVDALLRTHGKVLPVKGAAPTPAG